MHNSLGLDVDEDFDDFEQNQNSIRLKQMEPSLLKRQNRHPQLYSLQGEVSRSHASSIKSNASSVNWNRPTKHSLKEFNQKSKTEILTLTRD
jgi:hypothetical protein